MKGIDLELQSKGSLSIESDKLKPGYWKGVDGSIKTKNEFGEEIIEFVYATCQTRMAVRMKISIWAKKFDKSEEKYFI